MTSKASSPRGRRAMRAPKRRHSIAAHDFAVSMRAVLPVMAIGLATFLVLIPLSTAIVPETSIFNITYTHNQLKYRFMADGLVPAVLGASVLQGIVLAAFSLRFLLAKRETTAFFSLAKSRGMLFDSRLAASAIAACVSIVIPMLVSLVENIVALGAIDGIFEQWLYVCAGLVLVTLVSFMLSAIGFLFAGTMPEALIFAVALITAMSDVCFGANAIMGRLLVGNAFGACYIGTSTEIASSLLESLAPINPVLFFYAPLASHQAFSVLHPVYVPPACDWTLVIGWLATTVALALACRLLMVHRAGEQAGMSGLAPAVNVAVAILAGIAAFGCMFSILSGIDAGISLACGFAAFLLAMLVLLYGPLRGTASPRRTLALCGISVAALSAFVVIIATGGLGYSSRLPEPGSVSSVSVSYAGSPNYVSAEFDTATASKGSYYYNTMRAYTSADAISSVEDAQRMLISSGTSKLSGNSDDWSKTVVPYDVVIRYKLDDGTEMDRYYSRASFSAIRQLAALDSGEDAAALDAAVIDGDLGGFSQDEAAGIQLSPAYQAYRNGTIYLGDCRYAQSFVLNCGSEARAALLKALADDVAAQDFEDRYHPQGSCLGVIMFTQNASTDEGAFSYALENTVVYLTSSFKETLAWLDGNGLSQYIRDPGAGVVESMAVQKYDPYIGKNAVVEPKSIYFMGYRAEGEASFIVTQDYGKRFTTDDAAEMGELLPLLRNNYLMDGGGYLVSAKIAGANRYSYYFLPKSDAPDWLVRQVG